MKIQRQGRVCWSSSALFGLLLLFSLSTVRAATLLVYNLNDSAAGSLRQALADNQALGGSNTIVFSNTVAGTIVLTGGQLVINTSVTIVGPGQNVLTLDGNSTVRILQITAGTVNLSGLTLANGNSDPGAGGGSAIMNNGVCTVNDVAFLSNKNGNHGGAIHNLNTLACTNCTFANGQSASGGALYNDATATLVNCTLSGNDSYLGGMGAAGGAIFNGGPLTLNACTISGNTGNTGGGIDSGASLTINSCTIVNNDGHGVGGGITWFTGSATTIHNSIVAGNSGTTGPDCNGPFTSTGYNLIGKTNNSTGWGAVGDQLGSTASPVNPQLGPLQNNGGPTLTMVPLAGSLAIDQGKNNGLATDQRGRPRTFDTLSVPNANLGDGTDIGAAETGPATFLVTTTNDSGAGSLRQAVVYASPSEGDTINFATNVTGTITLTSGELPINGNLTITGPGAGVLAVSGNNASLIFDVLGGNVALSGLTLRNGHNVGLTGGFESSGFDGRGGAIFNQATLAVSDCVISSNTVVGGQGGSTGSGVAGNGGNGLGAGIANLSTLILTRCAFTGNTATGGSGGIATSGGSLGAGGQSYGGGLYNFGTAAFVNCTLNGNFATAGSGGGGPGGGNGGGIYNTATLTLTNCTLVANTANGSSFDFGGGLYDLGSGVFLRSCTVASNVATFGGGLNTSSADLATTILAGNAFSGGIGGGPDCSGTIHSSDYNLIQNTSGCTITGTTTHNLTGLNPQLGALQNNGGPTFTMALAATSPAIDKGKSSGLTTDQRGSLRPADFASLANAGGGDGSDIGAFEYLPPSPTLNIQSLTNSMVLAWPTNAVDFRLQSRTNLTSGTWAAVAGTLVKIGTQYNLTNAASPDIKFYRLIFP